MEKGIKMKDPLVSVIMPCYNCELWVEEAIESIMQQSYKNIEVIVVDDNSNDASVSIVERHIGDKLSLIAHRTNKGISRTLNDGIVASKGHFIARMDADDISDRYRLEKQTEMMASDDKIAVLGTGVRIIDEDGEFLYHQFNPTEDKEIRDALAYTLPVWPGSQMWRRSKIYEAGLFDENIPGCEDLEMTLRLAVVGKAKNIRLPLYTYRKNVSGESNIGIISLTRRAMLARKAFALKNISDKEGIKRLYKIFSMHYSRTHFGKGLHTPPKNRYHYYINVALSSLLCGNRDGAKTFMKWAREEESRGFTNFMILGLIIGHPLIVSFIHKASRLGKKYLYILYAGNAARQLNKKRY